MLACWGVLLVTRGRVRRAVAVLGLLAAVGLVVAVVVGLRHAARPGRRRRCGQSGSPADSSATELTAWFWVAAAVGPWLLRRRGRARRPLGAGTGPRWAAGTTRRAPRRSRRAAAGGPQSNLDLWKAMDEGRDPTA